MEMHQIEQLTYDYSGALAKLTLSAQAIDEEVRKLKSKHNKNLLRQIRAVKEAKQALQLGIESSPGLFNKPKTTVFYGVRVGYKKAKGRIVIESTKKTIKAIKSKLPDKIDVLIETTEKLLKKVLSTLPACDLKKIGVEVTQTGDYVFIKSEKTDNEKVIEALISEYDDDE